MDQQKYNYLKELYVRYLNNETSADESEMILQLLSDPSLQTVWSELILDSYQDEKYIEILEDDKKQIILKSIFGTDSLNAEEVVTIPLIRKKIQPWFKIAVSILLLIITTYFIKLYINNDSVVQFSKGEHILPAKEGIVLTLSNNQEVFIHDSSKNILLKDIGVEIERLADGSLVYHSLNERSVKNVLNKISTGKGQSIQITLPDQTKVWLNAQSSIIYSTQLNELEEREVEMSGEVYFEVARQYNKNNQRTPFRVKSNHQIVEVLGTSFNVNSYDRSFTYTTLIEGAVAVKNKLVTKKLKPNEQSLVDQHGINIRYVETEDIIAWKNGIFYFNNYTIDQVLDQIKNWYDVEVHFDGEMSREVFSGMIDRNRPLNEVLNMLEKTQTVQFKVFDNKVYVQ